MQVILRKTDEVSIKETKTISAIPSEDAAKTIERAPIQKAALRKFMAEGNLMLLQANPNVNGVDKALLMRAQGNQDINIVEILLEYGNNPKGWPAICYAAYLGHENIVRALVQYGADVKSKCNEGSVLDFSIDNHNLGLIQYLIDRGATVDYTFFDRCLKTEFREGLTYYFDKGNKFPPSALNERVWTLIETKKPVDLIKLLIERGKADLKCNRGSYGLLSVAVARGDADFITYLIAKGVSINFLPQQGWSEDANRNPIVLALSSNRTDILKILIDSGINIPKFPSQTTTVSMIWVNLFRNYNLDTIRTLVNKGLNIECGSPLKQAIMLKNIDLAAFLLEKGANVSNKNDGFGKTPLKLAIESGNRAIIDLLIKYGARIDDI